ncbi:hypothetical protein D8S78_12200 [Natrialba swarupiae]|nr:hypothetical protein [Natrialba swarupiae]
MTLRHTLTRRLDPMLERPTGNPSRRLETYDNSGQSAVRTLGRLSASTSPPDGADLSFRQRFPVSQTV